MFDLSSIPSEAVGLRLCKVTKRGLTLYEEVIFTRGRAGVEIILRRAEVCGPIGPVGETGDFWADFLLPDRSWFDTVALSRDAWNSLKNHWMRCKVADHA